MNAEQGISNLTATLLAKQLRANSTPVPEAVCMSQNRKDGNFTTIYLQITFY